MMAPPEITKDCSVNLGQFQHTLEYTQNFPIPGQVCLCPPPPRPAVHVPIPVPRPAPGHAAGAGDAEAQGLAQGLRGVLGSTSSGPENGPVAANGLQEPQSAPNVLRVRGLVQPWLVAGGGWWRLAFGGGWRLVAVGGWRLVVPWGGP